MSYVVNALNEVVEAATVRQQQWCMLGAGASVDDVVQELYEADRPECRSHADRLAAAISVVNQFIVASKMVAPIVDAE